MSGAAWLTIVRSSVRMNVRRLTFWVFSAVFVLIVLLLYIGQLKVGGTTASGVKLALNADYSIAVVMGAFTFMLMHFTATLTGDALLRDRRLGIAAIVRSAGTPPRVYALSKFCGAWLTVLGIYAVFVVALIAGQAIPTDETYVQGFRVLAYFKYALLFIVVPTFFVGTLSFAIGTLSGNMKLVYGLATAFLIGWAMVANLLENMDTRYWAYLEPSGLAWLSESVAKNRGNAWMNEHGIALDSGFLLNRAGLVVLGFAALMLTVLRFPATAVEAVSGDGSGKLERFGNWLRKRPQPLRDPYTNWIGREALPAVQKETRAVPLWLAQFTASVRTELRLLFAERSLWIMAPMVMFLCGVSQTTWSGPFQVEIYPVSSEYARNMMPLLLIMLAGMSIFYTGEVFHRDDTGGVRPILYATPLANSVLVLSKLVAMVVLSLVIVLLTVATAIVSQWIEWRNLDGRAYLDLGPYVDMVMGIALPSILVICTLALAVNVIVRGRYLAYFVCILLASGYVWLLIDGKRSLVYNPFLIGHVSYSDITTLEPFRERIALHHAYWASILIAAVLLSSLLLRRTLGGWSALGRGARPSHRVAMLLVLVAVGAAVVSGRRIAARGNPFGSPTELERIALELEDRYLEEFDAPRLAWERVELTVDLHPAESAVDVRGNLLVSNPYDEAIETARFTIDPRVTIQHFQLAGNSDRPVNDHGVLNVTLAEPIPSGSARALEFAWTVRLNDDFEASGGEQTSFVHADATFLSSFTGLLAPRPGIAAELFLIDRDRRAKYGREPLRLLEDASDRAFVPSLFGADKPFRYTARISVPVGPMVVSGGELVDRKVFGDREVFTYASKKPVQTFAILASDYERVRDGQDEVYYHRQHDYNLSTILEALRDGRSFFGEHFGEYPHELLRIAEFPRLAGFAQSFPTVMPYSEAIGFLTNYRKDPRLVDATYFVTAHEVAHQWWGYVVSPGRSLGGQVLSESLAEYSGLLLLEHTRGELERLKFLKREEDAYLRRRDVDREVALAALEFEGAPIWYNKGCLVFAMLDQQIGRERVLAGLGTFARAWRYETLPSGRAPSHPTLTDLLDTLQEHHEEIELGWFYDQWFEGVVLPDMAVDQTEVVRSPTGYDIRFRISNRGTGRVPVRVEAIAGDWDLGERGFDPVESRFRASEPAIVWVGPDASVEAAISCDFRPSELIVDRTFGCIDFDRTNNRASLELPGEDEFARAPRDANASPEPRPAPAATPSDEALGGGL